MTNAQIIIPVALLLSLSAYIIALQLAYRKARTELAALRSKPTLVPNPAMTSAANYTGAIERLSEKNVKYRDALVDIGKATEKGQNGTARMINRKVVAALKG